MKRIFIDGNSGTTGLRIEERLKKRRDIELLKIDDGLRRDESERRKLINLSDITFLCLPDDASKKSVSLCENENTVIIDASTAHRVNPSWAYGFPELSSEFKSNIASSKRIAVPGCHATGFISAVYPLVNLGLLPRDYPFSCFSLTGYSGGGKKMINDYENNKTSDLFSPRLYGLSGNHKHLKEMKYITGVENEPIFTPIVDDYYSGMATSVPVFAKSYNLTLNVVFEAFCEFYKDSKLISVYKGNEISFLPANDMAGLDNMKIYITGNDERIVITSVFDNLGKGASGAAIECMNISLGLDETSFLDF